jgi:SAM-dependent methyltransferase
VPPRGRALDLACGRGANALFLAARGLEVDAWDFSPVAIERLTGAAEARGLQIAAEVRDVVARPPPAGIYGVILVSYFLERSLAPALQAALRPGGLLFYQTFVHETVSSTGPTDARYRLGPGELLALFSKLRPRYFRDDGRIGDLSQGVRDVALLVAEREH